ncbi:Pyruvate carboxyltransferase [Macrophomina phaseolina MS6]|uniref:2-isopropylmalate synthase n=1 Tax=Macrophomina phaseolina (strain MS6) TaxID=1126212 RepID=K2R1M6_MACPH|nr:Pyruvate carboxyltransferase [Macrophomina phaseolina MS6]
MFKLLVAIGFKEIEVAFPCASRTDYEFVRYLIETPGLVPDDVALQVITPCREDAIQTAVDSLRGAKRAIMMTYMASSDNLRETVLQLSEDEWIERARRCTAFARSLLKDDPSVHATNWTFNFGFEDFANARPEAVLRCADAVLDEWDPTPAWPMILGVAASVEVTTPNVFADQIEYFLRNVPRRNDFRLTVHTHNDRGGAVATAELACLAGADRVEGCLFGNGERAGNMDLVVFALNLLTSGIDPGLDFSSLDTIRKVYEEMTKLPVHPRTPYSGDYYFRAFSGAHQDAISKGLKSRARGSHGDRPGLARWPAWRVPYLPLDPADVGRSLDCVVGINSQSGKGGIAWILQHSLGLEIPADLARVFSKTVKEMSDRAGRGIPADELCLEFLKAHGGTTLTGGASVYRRSKLDTSCSMDKIVAAVLESPSAPHAIISRLLGLPKLSVTTTSQNMYGTVHLGEYAAYTKVALEGSGAQLWGVGFGENENEAEARAILAALLVGAFPAHLFQ